MLLEHQISARLAKRVGWPVFVSCSFSGWGGDTATAGGGGASSDVMASPAMSAGYDDSMQRHAAEYHGFFWKRRTTRRDSGWLHRIMNAVTLVRLDGKHLK